MTTEAGSCAEEGWAVLTGGRAAGVMDAAIGVAGPGTASEVALALKAGKPVVLLAASAEAAAFFQRMDPGLNLAATTADAIRLLQTRPNLPVVLLCESRGDNRCLATSAILLNHPKKPLV